MNAPAQTDPDLALVNQYSAGMAHAYEVKATCASLVKGTIIIDAQCAKDTATVIRAYIKITEAMDLGEKALRDRAERAELALALTEQALGQIDKLSLLGLLFYRLHRGTK